MRALLHNPPPRLMHALVCVCVLCVYAPRASTSPKRTAEEHKANAISQLHRAHVAVILSLPPPPPPALAAERDALSLSCPSAECEREDI